jgi:hypothetical protein
MYPMGHYPMIVEFRAMLAGLAKIEPPRAWDGEHFFGYIAELKGGNEFWFRSQRTGVSYGFTKEEWRVMQELFRKAWEHPELKRAWDGLSLEYGEL